MLAGFIVIITTHSSALIYQQSMFVDAFGGGPRRVRVSENAIIKMETSCRYGGGGHGSGENISS